VTQLESILRRAIRELEDAGRDLTSALEHLIGTGH
jgi:hypothetical protein